MSFRMDLSALQWTKNGAKHTILLKLRKPYCGSRAEAKLKAKGGRYKLYVPSILMKNLYTLINRELLCSGLIRERSQRLS